jgi:glycosyltransferase involved in cell wall biosynthesis
VSATPTVPPRAAPLSRLAAAAASFDDADSRARRSRQGGDADSVSDLKLDGLERIRREIDPTRTVNRSPVVARICVGVATRGRPTEVQRLVQRLRQQTLSPQAIIIACVSGSDVGALTEGDELKILPGPAGLARQRNRVLANLPDDCEFVVFFDDDFWPRRDWLSVVFEAFRRDPALACVTGNVVADGILGPGLSYADAERAVDCNPSTLPGWRIERFSPYGCNMAFRRSAIDGLQFDERLVLYGWLEDLDFGARVARDRGGLIKLGAAIGAHLGVKGGRVSGRRLGYSQVMNPFYMNRKGTLSARGALRQVFRNVCANAAKSLWSEPYVDRRGRLLGNFIGFADLMRGRCTPERAERL